MKGDTLRQLFLPGVFLVAIPGILVQACSGRSGGKSPDSGAPPADAGSVDVAMLVATGGRTGTGGSIPDGPAATGGNASGGGVLGSGGQTSSGTVAGGGGGGGTVLTGGMTGRGGSVGFGGSKATGGRAGTGGGVGTGGATSAGGVLGSGGIAATGGAIQDASVPQDCACTLENDAWQVSLDCLCTVRDCSVTLSDFQTGGRLEGAFWYLEEFAECGVAREVETTPRIDTTRTFDLTTGKLVGQSETVNAGALCPFGADAGRTIFWLSAGQTVPTGCAVSRCTNGSSMTGPCQ